MCRPDGRHVLNNQGTDDYVLTIFKKMYIRDNVEVVKRRKPIAPQMGFYWFFLLF